MKPLQNLLFGFLIACAVYADPAWQVVGPGGGGGQFFPTLNANDPDNVMVRCDMSGTFITHDSGETWQMVNFGKSPLDYAIDPADANCLYVAAQGLFRSRDQGLTWELVYPVASSVAAIQHFGDHADPEIFLTSGERVPEVSVVRVDPEDGDHVWIGRLDGSVLYTLDGCTTWSTLDSRLDGPVRQLFPGSWWGRDNEVLAGGADSLVLMQEGLPVAEKRAAPDAAILTYTGGVKDGEVFLYAQSAEAVYTSKDLGLSWERSLAPVLLEDLRFTVIDACEQVPAVAYLGCRSGSEGILKTEDGGSTWSWVYRVAGNTVVTNNYTGAWLDASYGPDWRGYPLGIGISPVNPDVCYASDFGSTYRTFDGGATWEQVYSHRNADGSFTSRGLDVTTCYGVHFDPFDPGHMFVSYTDIGALQSFDGGKGWEHAIDGIPPRWQNTCYWMTFDPDVPGKAWSVWGSKHDLPRHKMFRHGRLLERAAGGVAISDDAGRSWSTLDNNGLPADAVCTHILLDPSSPAESRILYLTAFQRGLYKSVDSGTSWSRLPDVPGSNRNYWRLAQLPGGDLFVMVARDRKGDRWQGQEFPGGLYRSRDGGLSWEVITLPRGYDFPHDLTFDPANPDVLYLSLWAGSFEGSDPDTPPVGGGLLMSKDGGSSWKQVFDPTSFVYSATPDPRLPGRVYLVTFEGAAFYSEDQGGSWNLIHGFDFKWSHRPVLDPKDPEMLYITTFGGGLWHGPANGSGSNPLINVNPLWRWHRVLVDE